MDETLKAQIYSDRLSLQHYQRDALFEALEVTPPHEWPDIVTNHPSLSHTEKTTVRSEVIHPLMAQITTATLGNSQGRSAD